MSSTTCAVSVIIPTYNNASYIEETIESVLNQSLRPEQIIVVDDGSTDNTREVVNNFNDRRIRYIYQKNQGVSVARNTGLNLAEG